MLLLRMRKRKSGWTETTATRKRRPKEALIATQN